MSEQEASQFFQIARDLRRARLAVPFDEWEVRFFEAELAGMRQHTASAAIRRRCDDLLKADSQQDVRPAACSKGAL